MPLVPGNRWLFISIPALLVALGVLVFSVRGLLGFLRGKTVTTVTLRTQSTIAIPSAGTHDLSVSGRLGTTDFAGVDFQMHDESGNAVPMRPVLMRVSGTSMSGRSTLQLRKFDAPRTGNYVLTVTGIREGSDPGNTIVIGRPAGFALVGWILAIVLSAALLILSIVASALVRAQR
jgi:hypothetical protein